MYQMVQNLRAFAFDIKASIISKNIFILTYPI